MDFTPDEDGVIDLTILDDDSFNDLIATELSASPRTSGTNPPCVRRENRDRLNRTNTLRCEPTVASPLCSAAGDQCSALASGSSLAVKKPRPPYNYANYGILRPKVIYIKREEYANEMVASLNGAIGLDLEWPFSRDLGRETEGRVALVQLCDVDIILLIHISKMQRFPRKVKELIESSKVPKLGVNIRNDGRKLFCDYGIVSSNLIELGALACQVDVEFASAFKRPIVSLAKMVDYYLKKTLDKGPVRTSDWSKDLSRNQMIYASNDVHSGLMVYKCIMRAARSSNAELLPENYTADLASELRRRDVNKISTALTYPPDKASPQYAYALWYHGHGLLDICIRMGNRANPQRETTVISHILRVLTENPALPFSMSALVSLIRLDSSSWNYHRDTIKRWAHEGRGIDR